jgi:hypothetical protein
MKASVVLCLVGLLAVSAQPAWNITQFNWATIAEAISFSSPMNGIAPVGVNGLGSQVWHTTDGGNTWNPVPSVEELMYLGGAASGNNAVVADEFSLDYSDLKQNGEYNFTASTVTGGMSSQNVESGAFAPAGTWFAATGEGLTGDDGVAVSSDSGATFTLYNITNLLTEARYGAFPSATTWYISAGEWPQNNAPGTHAVTRRIHLQKNGKNFKRTIKPVGVRRHEEDSGWKAQIMKTSDGGNTWTSVFYREGQFYFNQISCGSESHCCAVAEADSSATPGIHIFCTVDGGSTWVETLSNTNGAYSIMAIDFINDQEAWAGGGDMDNFYGYFWHTLDGGKTWAPDIVEGVYVNCMSWEPTGKKGWATAFNAEDNSALLIYQ